MRDVIKVIRVFIGSPGGLEPERQAAHKVVNEVNLSCADHWGCEFKLLGWENVVPGFQRPQEKINEDLDRCKYFIGAIWDRWGTRTSTEPDGYTSGFEEEYYRAKQRIQEGSMKDMLLLFKQIEIPSGMLPGEDLSKVLQFRETCKNEKQVLFRDFKDLTAFEECVRSKLMEIGWKESEDSLQVSLPDRSGDQSSAVTLDSSTPSPDQNGLVEPTAHRFIIDLLSRPSDWEATKPHEVARFRLIAASVSRVGNDQVTIGAHDANLIYKHYRNQTLSAREIAELAECGVAAFDIKNVPVWNWLSQLKSLQRIGSTIEFWTLTQSRRKNALKILQCLGQGIPEIGEVFTKADVIKSWIVDETDSGALSAALSLIASNANLSDLNDIEPVIAEVSIERQSQIRGALAGVIARSSVQRALRYLLDHAVDSVPRSTIDRIFATPTLLQKETLLDTLSAKNDEVRGWAARLLSQRGDLDTITAQTLLTDPSYQVRYWSALSLLNSNAPLDDAVAQKILVIERKGSGGLFSQPSRDSQWYDKYATTAIATEDIDKVRDRVKAAAPFASKEFAALYRKIGAKARIEIYDHLKDTFGSFFDASLEEMTHKFGSETKLVSEIRKLEKHVRGQLSSVALTALCRLRSSNDIAIVRSTVDSCEIEASREIVNYFGSFGDWSDVGRIISMRSPWRCCRTHV